MKLSQRDLNKIQERLQALEENVSKMIPYINAIVKMINDWRDKESEKDKC